MAPKPGKPEEAAEPVAAQSVEDPLLEASLADECAVEALDLCIDRAAAEAIEHEYAERLPSFVCAVLMQNVNEVAAWYLLEHERAIDARAPGWAVEAEPSAPTRERWMRGVVPSKSTKSGAGAGAGDEWPEGDTTKRKTGRKKKAADEPGDTGPVIIDMAKAAPKLSPEEAAFEAKMKAEYDELMRRMKEEQDAAARAAREALERLRAGTRVTPSFITPRVGGRR